MRMLLLLLLALALTSCSVGHGLKRKSHEIDAEAVPTFEASLAARAGNTDCTLFRSLLLSHQLLLFHSSEQARRPGTE